jgi:hypothetical protein
MTKLTGAALDRAVAHAMGLKSVHNCEQWGKTMDDDDDTQVYGDALTIAYQLGYYDGKKAAQPAQEPDVVMHWDSHTWTTNNAPPKGSGDVNLYYAPATQRPWVEPRGIEWFNWWRVSRIADATEAEIDFADFITIALAVSAKLKEKNNG